MNKLTSSYNIFIKKFYKKKKKGKVEKYYRKWKLEARVISEDEVEDLPLVPKYSNFSIWHLVCAIYN